jgi:hypothetical protein
MAYIASNIPRILIEYFKTMENAVKACILEGRLMIRFGGVVAYNCRSMAVSFDVGTIMIKFIIQKY